jgi:hypothetical protein
MALHTLGSNATTSLIALAGWSQILAQADMGALDQTIANDAFFAAILSQPGAQTAVTATGTTASTATVTALVARGGSPPLSTIQAGDLVLGAGIVPAGTYVVTPPGGGTTVVLSQAALTATTLQPLAFVRGLTNLSGTWGLQPSGQLIVPQRGVLKILPGDVVAIDNLGFPILVSGASISYAASVWHFV